MLKKVLFLITAFTICFIQAFAQLAQSGLQRLALPAQVIEFGNGIGGRNVGEIISYCADHGKSSPTSATPESTYRYFPIDEKCVYVDDMPPISFAEAIGANLLSISTSYYDKIQIIKKIDKKIKIIITDLVVPSPEKNFNGELIIPKSLLTTKKEDIQKNQVEIWQRQKLYELGKLDKASIDNEKMVGDAKKKMLEEYYDINKNEFSNLLDIYTREIELLQEKSYLKKGENVTLESVRQAKATAAIANELYLPYYVSIRNIFEASNTYFISKTETSSYYLFDNNKNLLINNGQSEDIQKYIQEKLSTNETVYLLGNNFENEEKLEAFCANIEIRIKSESGKDLSIISNSINNFFEGNNQLVYLSSDYYQHKLSKLLTDNDIKERAGDYVLSSFIDSKYATEPIEKNTIELTAISKQKTILTNLKTYLNAKLNTLKKVNLWNLLKNFKIENKLRSSDIKYYVGSKAGKINIGKIGNSQLGANILYVSK